MTLFANAKVVPAKQPKGAKKPIAEVQVDDLENVAAIDAVIKSLTSMKESMTAAIKAGPMTEYFVTEGAKLEARPENYRGVDGDASASMELRARASNKELTADEQLLCRANEIPVVETEETIETFIFNPAYLADTKLMGQIEAALKKVKGLPEDIIMRQEGVKKTTLGAEALNLLFKKDKSVIRDLLPMLGVLAIKPTQEMDNLPAAFARVHALVVPQRKPTPVAKA